jgi:UDP-N-acetylglucosamine 3-dehydrogenase
MRGLRLSAARRVGIIGGGNMAHTHVQSLLAFPGATLVGVAAPEISAPIAKLCADAGVPVNPDPAWLLGETGIDDVVIATPTDTHGEWVARAAASGISVFCEKPIAGTVEAARAAVEVCERAGVKLAVGHVVRYFPSYAEIRDSVHKGEIGAPGMAKCRRMSGPPAGSRSWYADPKRSGGLIMDMGVHDFDWLRWCLGPVSRVTALARAGAGGKEVAMVSLRHHSGAVSTVELSWMDPRGFWTSLEVAGSAGLLTYDSRDTKPYRMMPWPGLDPVERPSRDPGDHPYREELVEALDWFGGGPVPRCTAVDGLAAIAVAEAAYASVARGEPVEFTDPAVLS